jgi:outer membrane lipoprotein-sorting protein
VKQVPHAALLAVGILGGLQAPDPWPVLDHASQVYQTISTLSADFVQIVANPMIGAPDTTRGRLYQMRPSRFAMRFTDPKGDRIVPQYGTTGPNLIGQFVEHPRERYTARYVRADSLADGMADVVTLKPKAGDEPYTAATIWVRRDDGLVRRLEITEASGQERTVVLANLKVNAGVPGREFAFSPPGGVRVVDQ